MPRTGKDWALGLAVDELSRGWPTWWRHGWHAPRARELGRSSGGWHAADPVRRDRHRDRGRSSALAALARGAVAEILGLVSWIGAAIVAVPGDAATRPRWSGPWSPVKASPTGWRWPASFLVALIPLKLVTGWSPARSRAARWARSTRCWGCCSAPPAGCVLVCAAYLLGSYLVKPEAQPDWVPQAYLITPVRTGALRLEGLLPESYRQDGLGKRTRAGPVTAGQGYTTRERQALDKLVAPQP